MIIITVSPLAKGPDQCVGIGTFGTCIGGPLGSGKGEIAIERGS